MIQINQPFAHWELAGIPFPERRFGFNRHSLTIARLTGKLKHALPKALALLQLRPADAVHELRRQASPGQWQVGDLPYFNAIFTEFDVAPVSDRTSGVLPVSPAGTVTAT